MSQLCTRNGLNRLWIMALLILMVVGPFAKAADPAKAKQKTKKPGNATIDKATAKERKALAKVLEKQGADEESTRQAIETITPADRREALQTIKAIESFVKAVETAEKAANSDTATIDKLLSDRPRKVVEKPTLKPSDIDRLMGASLSKSGIQAAGITNDGTFLRRVSLDLIGLIPSPEQVTQFEQSTDPEKRSTVIKKLLASPFFCGKSGKILA